jgi:FtsP/CotA-like multicopper oxidase with cupredoxin domain
VVEVIPGTRPANLLPATLPPLPPFLQNLAGPIADTAALFRDTASMPVIVFSDSNFTTRNPSPLPPQFWLGTVADPQQQFNDTLVYIPTTSRDVARPMLLGQLQTWRVENIGQSTNHPFHIHINPFQVVYAHFPKGEADPNAPLYRDLNAAAQGNNPIWLDVLALPLPAVDSAGNVTDAGYVIIRQQYENFTGQYVMHCHILGHEERGMMQLLEVFGDSSAVRHTVPGGAHHQH